MVEYSRLVGGFAGANAKDGLIVESYSVMKLKAIDGLPFVVKRVSASPYSALTEKEVLEKLNQLVTVTNWFNILLDYLE